MGSIICKRFISLWIEQLCAVFGYYHINYHYIRCETHCVLDVVWVICFDMCSADLHCREIKKKRIECEIFSLDNFGCHIRREHSSFSYMKKKFMTKIHHNSHHADLLREFTALAQQVDVTCLHTQAKKKKEKITSKLYLDISRGS